MKKRMLKAKQWAEERFEPGFAPSPRTLRQWCVDGVLPAQKIGRFWYIDIDAQFLDNTGNPLIDMVLNES